MKSNEWTKRVRSVTNDGLCDSPVETVMRRAEAWELPTPFSAMHWYSPSSWGPTLETRSTLEVRRWRGDGARGRALWSHITEGVGLPRAWQMKRTVSPYAASCCCSSTVTWGGSAGDRLKVRRLVPNYISATELIHYSCFSIGLPIPQNVLIPASHSIVFLYSCKLNIFVF